MFFINRLVCIASISYIIGIICGLYNKSIAFLIVILVLLFIQNKKSIIIILFILIGLTQITYCEKDYENTNIPEELETQAIVVSEATEKQYKNVYKIKLKKINKCVLLNVKKNNSNILQYGDLIYIKGKYEKPNTAKNYKGFDYEKYLKSKNIYGIVDCEELEIVKEKYVINYINEIQKIIKNNVRKIFDNTNQGELLIAILLGDKQDLDKNIQEDFKNSNLSHMLAVSGAHTSYVILGISYLLEKMLIGKRKGKSILILVLIFFMMLTNFTPSVTRACIMAILNLLGSIFYKKADTYTNLAIASFIIIAVNPYTIFDIGFQLSFGGTIGIVFFANSINGKEKNKFIKYVKQAFLISLYANLIIIPIMAYQFNTLSLTFFISNIVATPILGITIILGFIVVILTFILPFNIPIFNIILTNLLTLFLSIAHYGSLLPFSKILAITPSIISILSYYIILIKIRTKKYKTKIICILIIIIIVSNIPSNYFNQDLKIYFIDVGQGDSTFLITPKGKTILIDGGGSESETFNVGEQILLPYLLDRKIVKLDYIIISHFDTDHVGGILTVLQKLSVKNVIIGKQFGTCENYEKFLKIVKVKNIKLHIVEAGQRINIDSNIYFDILWPNSKKMITENSLNNNSLVCKMVYKNFSMLFTGDIEEPSEQEISKLYGEKLKATIIKIPHHGSNTSSTTQFIKLVNPRIALIGVGEKNTFGHPNIEVLKRLEQNNCTIYRTDKDGEITIRINRNGRIWIEKRRN